MMTEYTAINLQTMDYNENDSKLVLLSTSGIVYAILKGVKKPTAKLKQANLPFACGIYTIASNTNIITSFESIQSFGWIVNDYDKYIHASIACEACMLCKYDKDTTNILLELLALFRGLLADNYADSLSQFLTKLLSYLGYCDDYSNASLIEILTQLQYNTETELKSVRLLQCTK
ncbi:MAG: recombination protein O N-terminal domain-containing protein [Clostridiales bacterium]|jgi:DNA repair protein RecO|nr:recombination protein O N-terminal domain-containing protein [Clostridiales bacterium]